MIIYNVLKIIKLYIMILKQLNQEFNERDNAIRFINKIKIKEII